MSEYRKIAVLLDGSESDSDAMERAFAMAKASSSRLEVIVGRSDGSLDVLRHVNGTLAKALTDRQSEPILRELQGVSHELCSQGVGGTVHLLWGHPVLDVLIKRLLETKPDLVVRAVVDQSGEGLGRFSSLDLELLRFCPFPMLLVSSKLSALPRKILVAVDDDRSPASKSLNESILMAGLAHAIQSQAQIHLVHAYPHAPELLLGSGTDSPAEPAYLALLSEWRTGQLGRFHALADRFGVPSDHRHFLEGGDAAEQISELAASQKFDTVVVGTVYRKAAQRLMMGSTAERLLRQIDCDILAIKPDNFRTEVLPAQHFERASYHEYPATGI